MVLLLYFTKNCDPKCFESLNSLKSFPNLQVTACKLCRFEIKPRSNLILSNLNIKGSAYILTADLANTFYTKYLSFHIPPFSVWFVYLKKYSL